MFKCNTWMECRDWISSGAAGYIPFLVYSPASTSAVPVATYSDVSSGKEVRKESTSNTERHKPPNLDIVYLPQTIFW